MRLPRVGVTLAVAIVVLLVTATGGWASGTFRLGTYTGKTSQGKPVKLIVEVGTSASVTFIQTPASGNGIDLQAPCAADTTQKYGLSDYLNVVSRLPPSGVVHVTQKAFGDTEKATIRVSHSGTLTATATVGNSGCKRTTVKFSAKL
jgi:hypothetical protein